MHCASLVWTDSKQELGVQISPVRRDQCTQTSDVYLQQLVLDLEQLSQKFTSLVLQRSTSSAEYQEEQSSSIKCSRQQFHPESVQVASLQQKPTETCLETYCSLEGLPEESQQALNMVGLC